MKSLEAYVCEEKKSTARRFFDYIFPFLDRYDARREAEMLSKDERVAELGVAVDTLIPYLKNAEREKKWLRAVFIFKKEYMAAHLLL